MPQPYEGENKSAYISRCVRQVMGEGKNPDAAAGQCHGMWDEHVKKLYSFNDVLKQSVQGVHQTTAIGNADRKRRSFNELVAQQSHSTKRPSIEKPVPTDDGDDDDIVQGVKPKGKSWSIPIEVKKADAEQRLIFGWASVAALDGEHIIDKQGDIIPVEGLEAAVIEYNLNSRDGGDMHARKGVSKLVESVVFTQEKEALGIVAKNDAGQVIHGWWTGFYVHDDDLWAAVKRGERPEYSIGGQAFPVEIDLGKKKRR